MKLNGVVFDLDHTLFDRYATLTAIAPEFCKHFKDKLSAEMTVEKVASLLCEGDKSYVHYGWKKVFEFICEKGMFSTLPEYEEYRSTLLHLFTTVAIPFPFTYTVLEKVKKRGLKCGLITNGNADIQQKKLSLLKLTDSFDAIVLCGALGKQKPDPAPFNEMARLLNCSPDTLIYVGDNPLFDVGGGRNAGYTTVEVLTANCNIPDAPVGDYRINTVDELDALIERIAD